METKCETNTVPLLKNLVGKKESGQGREVGKHKKNINVVLSLNYQGESNPKTKLNLNA